MVNQTNNQAELGDINGKEDNKLWPQLGITAAAVCLSSSCVYAAECCYVKRISHSLSYNQQPFMADDALASIILKRNYLRIIGIYTQKPSIHSYGFEEFPKTCPKRVILNLFLDHLCAKWEIFNNPIA